MDFYCFDFYGGYLGHIDANGAFFDRRGERWGALREGSSVYDLEGRYCGRVDPQGSLFGKDGRCRGYVRGWQAALPTIRLAGEPRQAAPAGDTCRYRRG